jgi:hypothetical protein
MTENSNSNADNGAGQIAMTADLFGWPGDGVHWAWLLRIPDGPDALDQPRPPGFRRGAWERRVPPGSRPVRGPAEASGDLICEALESAAIIF